MNLENIYLPKWPQMRVTGKKIEPEQALEIIRRTDIFFSGNGGNDHAFDNKAYALIGRPDVYKDYQKVVEWCDKWGVIPLEEVENDWISSAFVCGPNGWCHPDGTIFFGYNIGKWPDFEDVLADWTKIAKEFPFLEVEVTLMSGEESEDTEPVVSIKIKDGQAEVIDPSERDIHAEAGRPLDYYGNPLYECNTDRGSMADIFRPNKSHKISLAQIEKWAKEHPITL